MRRGRPPKVRKSSPKEPLWSRRSKSWASPRSRPSSAGAWLIPVEEFERLMANYHAECAAGRGRSITTEWFLRQAQMVKTPEPPDAETMAVLADLRRAVLQVSSPDERQAVLDTLRRLTVELIDRYPDEQLRRRSR